MYYLIMNVRIIQPQSLMQLCFTIIHYINALFIIHSFIHSLTIVNVVFSDDTPCGVERCLEHAVTSGLV